MGLIDKIQLSFKEQTMACNPEMAARERLMKEEEQYRVKVHQEKKSPLETQAPEAVPENCDELPI
jgi:hypothetical protein